MLNLFDSMTGPVVRSWHMRLPSAARGRREEVHKVQLRHFPLTGQRSVTVDGIVVEGVNSAGQLEHGGGKRAVTLKIRVGSHDCWVGYRAAALPGRYYYSCIIDGVVMPELNDTVGDGEDPDGEAIPLPGEVFVDSVSSAKDSSGADFLEFRVVTRRGGRRGHRGGGGGGYLGSNGGAAVADKGGGRGRKGGRGGREGRGGEGSGGDEEYCAVVWRRFSAFRALHSDIVAMLWGSHLLDSLPPLPAKCINPLVNQTGAAFVERRRAVLQAYLRRLLEVPKARASVNLMGFLGLHPITGGPLPWAAASPSTPREPAPYDEAPRAY